MIWDALIVGAGPAGCAAAYDLAAAGKQVLLVDRAEFPREKACAGALTIKAVRALRYSIAPVVRKTISEALLEHRSGPGQPVLVGRRTPFCMMTMRLELDAYCLEQTQRRGTQFRRVGALAGLTELADRVVVHVEGEAAPLEARFIVGADGVHSRVRALAAQASGKPAAWFRRGFAVERNVPYTSTGRDFPLTFDFAPVHGGYGWLFPRNDHVNVGLYTSRDTAVPAGAIGVDRAALDAYIAARCGTAQQGRTVGQFLGLGAARYAPSDTRTLLAGDAAGFVDPLTGEGIHGAIVSGQAAAAAILAALNDGVPGAAAYARLLRRQCADLAVSERAARTFYAEPERGFRLMRLPLVGRAVLHAYSDGTSLTTLARGLAAVRRFTGGLTGAS